MKKTTLLLTALLLSSCMSTGSERVKDGKEVYEYKYISVYNNPASYIPFVGLFFAPDKYLANYLYVTFDRFGNVETYEALSDTGDYPPEKAF